MATIEQLNQTIMLAVNRIKPAYQRDCVAAFWHDVGVTGLSALATAIGGAGLLYASMQTSCKIFVVFLSGSINVLVACNQYFRFKSRADAKHRALTTLLRIQNELNELKDWPSGDSAALHNSLLNLKRRADQCILDADLLPDEVNFIPNFSKECNLAEPAKVQNAISSS